MVVRTGSAGRPSDEPNLPSGSKSSAVAPTSGSAKWVFLVARAWAADVGEMAITTSAPAEFLETDCLEQDRPLHVGREVAGAIGEVRERNKCSSDKASEANRGNELPQRVRRAAARLDKVAHASEVRKRNCSLADQDRLKHVVDVGNRVCRRV